MYQIDSDAGLLYDPHMACEPHRLTVADTKLELAENKTGAFQFSLPLTHPLHGQIRKRITEVWLLDDGEEIFRGQALDSKGDKNCSELVICEGLKGLLRNVYLRPYTAEDYGGTTAGFLQMCVTIYNAHTTGRQFLLAPGAYSTALEIENKDYERIIDAIDNKMLKVAGGILTVTRENDKNVIRYISESAAPMGDQVIRYGVNMLDYNRQVSTKDMYTVVIPLGKSSGDAGKLTISSENDGKDYLESSAVSTYGRIERVENYNDIESASELKAKGQSMLAEAGQTLTELEVSAVDLTLAGIDVDKLRLSRQNLVSAQAQGTDAVMRLVKIYGNPLRGDAKYTFSSSFASLTKKNATSARAAASAMETASAAKTEAATAKATADAAVPKTTTVNGHALTGNVSDADYVIEVGSNTNGWKWRKWASGAIELWGSEISVSLGSWSAYTTDLQVGTGSANYPVTLADAASSCVSVAASTSGSLAYGIVAGIKKNAGSASLRILRSSTATSIKVDIYVRGTAAATGGG